MKYETLNRLMEWAASEEWGYKTWDIEKMKIPNKRLWTMRMPNTPENNKIIVMNIEFEEFDS